MIHKQEDIDAAEAFAKDWVAPKQVVKLFLAGIEHKQREVDELVEALMYARQFVTHSPSKAHNKYLRTVQKHAK